MSRQFCEYLDNLAEELNEAGAVQTAEDIEKAARLIGELTTGVAARVSEIVDLRNEVKALKRTIAEVAQITANNASMWRDNPYRGISRCSK